MQFSRELLFFFSALGVFNSVVLGMYFLFFAKPRHQSNYFLGILLLAMSIRIGKSVIFYFNPDLSATFLQLGMSGCLFIGPSIYFYLKSIVSPDADLKWKAHYIPLLIGIVTIGIIYPWETNPHFWGYLFDVIYFIWLIYLILSAFVIRKIIANLFKRSVKYSAMEIWIMSVYLGNFLVWIAYKTSNYTSYIVGALSFSFIFYLVILLLIFTRKKDPGFLNRHVKYGNRRIDEDEAKILHQNLNKLMQEELLFKDANLKLSDVARKLNVLPHHLSQYINDNLEKNFTNFLNEFRIEEAQKLIQQSDHLKLESIGYECGFNSKSTFYTAFKKVTGTTPAKFKDDLAS